MADKGPDLSIKPDEIDWRVGATYDGRDGKMAMLLGYIDARLAMDKLDSLDPKWSSHIEVMRLGDKDGVRCSLTVSGVTREDVGTASDTEPLKGAVSDALKRAAVHFGIGRELYDLPSIGVQVEVKSNGKAGKPKAFPVWKDGRWTIDPTLGWVKYDREPIKQPGRGAQTKPVSGPAPAPAQYRRDDLVAVMREKGLDLNGVEQYADLVGIPKGQTATDAQMDALIEAVKGHGTDTPLELPLGGAEPPQEAPKAEEMDAEDAIAAGAALVGKQA